MKHESCYKAKVKYLLRLKGWTLSKLIIRSGCYYIEYHCATKNMKADTKINSFRMDGKNRRKDLILFLHQLPENEIGVRYVKLNKLVGCL